MYRAFEEIERILAGCDSLPESAEWLIEPSLPDLLQETFRFRRATRARPHRRTYRNARHGFSAGIPIGAL
jgi:hypothetical protein